MYLRYGSYQFDADACEVQMRIQTQLSERGYPYSQIWQVSVRGYLSGSSVTDLSAKCLLLEAALAVPYQDIGLYTDAGVLTHVRLLNVGSTTGVTCSGPNYETGKGAELATYRSFSFTAKAEYPYTTGFVLLQYVERLQLIGTGGPKFVIRESLSGVPQRQYVKQVTKCSAIQSGRAVGYLSYPVPPAPLWPLDEVLPQRQMGEEAPRYRGNGWTDYPVSWSYAFEAALPLIGNPTVA